MKYAALTVILFSACSDRINSEAPPLENTLFGEAAAVHLTPEDTEFWRADFSWEQPVTELNFVRHSNKRRPDRLKTVDNDFEIFSTDEGDAIRRRDGAMFNAVSILEPTSIENPPAGYLPFAKFGDGGLLLYTGRFHTCTGACPVDGNRDEEPWHITIDPGHGQRMILNGVIRRGRASFADGGDGTKVYIGDGKVIDSPNLLAVIDTALPDTVTTNLNLLFPPLMDYFGERLGILNETQMLFASYNVPGDLGGSSIKGGTLPRQVFMHFEGEQIPEFSSEADFPYFLAWFFSHEAAHLHQGQRAVQYEEFDSWIHEGTAEAFAYLSLQHLEATPTSYLAKRLDRAKRNCADALAGGSLLSVLERDQPFQALYDCGLIIHLVVDAASRRSTGEDLFDAWTDFTGRVAQGANWNAETYLEVVRSKADNETAGFVEKIITTRVNDPAAVLDAGLLASGFVLPITE